MNFAICFGDGCSAFTVSHSATEVHVEKHFVLQMAGEKSCRRVIKCHTGWFQIVKPKLSFFACKSIFSLISNLLQFHKQDWICKKVKKYIFKLQSILILQDMQDTGLNIQIIQYLSKANICRNANLFQHLTA